MHKTYFSLVLAVSGALCTATAHTQLPDEVPPDLIERMLAYPPTESLPLRRQVSRDHLIFERSVQVEHHPNAYELHEPWSPSNAANCTPDYFLPCARVLWSHAHLPEIGEVFTAHMPAVVPPDGPSDGVIWTPTLHCMTYTLRHGQQWPTRRV